MEKVLQKKQAGNILGHCAQLCLGLDRGTVVQKHVDSVKYTLYAENALVASLW